MKNIRRTLIASAPAAALAASAAPATAQEVEIGGGGDTVAVVVNTQDGSSRFKVRFVILRATGDVLDNDNAAVAVASCIACRTIAVSFQVVLAFNDPSVVTTDNLAIALNIECQSCETLASAYQWVLGIDGVVHFTPEGNRAIAEIRRELFRLVRSNLSVFELQAELDELAEQLELILAQELVAAGPPGRVQAQLVDESTGEMTPLPEGNGTEEPRRATRPRRSPRRRPKGRPAPRPKGRPPRRPRRRVPP